MYIKCEHPRVILHPNAIDKVLMYGNYYIRSERVSLSPYQVSYFYANPEYLKIYPKRFGITKDEVDDCYIVDHSGVMHPLYLVVPCNKCILCTERKKNEWVTRAVCESQTSISRPLWIGLSYNDEMLPEHGVNKPDIQNFMKRLRIRLTRDGYEHELRYFVASEYGEDLQRPHYHMLIWNFPVMSDETAKSYLNRAWSKVVSEKEYKTLRSCIRFPDFKYKAKYATDVKIRKTVKNLLIASDYVITGEIKQYLSHYQYFRRIGYVYFGVYEDAQLINRIRYCMKYMHKDDKVPKMIFGNYNYSRPYLTLNIDPVFHDCTGRIKRHGKYKVRLIRYTQNKPFFLSSRKNAIGKQWLLSKLSEYEKYPQLNDCKIKDRWTDRLLEMPMPRYFKDLMHPCISRLVKKEVRDAFARFNKLLFLRDSHSLTLLGSAKQWSLQESSLIEKFKCLPFVNTYKFGRYSSDGSSTSDLRIVENDLRIVKDFLESVKLDSNYIIQRQDRKSLFSSFIIEKARHRPEIPIPDLVNRIKIKRRKAKERQKYLFIHREI